MKEKKIVVAGAGAIGTAIANVLAAKADIRVTLLSIEPDVVDSINLNRVNDKYFPGILLHSQLRATLDNEMAANADVLFFAVPSVAVTEVANALSSFIHPQTILVNLAKGYGNGSRTVAEILNSTYPNAVVSLKGPAFARELISHVPTGFTVGSNQTNLYNYFRDLFNETCIHLDFSDDLRGVELVSILKNIYAIAMGIVDAHYDSSNLRFMVLTRAFNEIRHLLRILGGKDETMFHFCGIGDFGLTALNDLSRNRTLGLLIGKGFFTETISDKVILEGKMAINVIVKEIEGRNVRVNSMPILNELYQVFAGQYKLPKFVDSIIRQ